MTKDYAQKRQVLRPKRRGGNDYVAFRKPLGVARAAAYESNSRAPWGWTISGFVVGLAIIGIIYIKFFYHSNTHSNTGHPSIASNKDITKTAKSTNKTQNIAQAEQNQEKSKNKPKKAASPTNKEQEPDNRFDFYTLLPAMEVVVPDLASNSEHQSQQQHAKPQEIIKEAPVVATAPVPAPVPTPAPEPKAVAPVEIKPEIKPEPKPAPVAEIKPAPKPEIKPEIKAEPKPEIKPEAKPKSESAPIKTGAFLVQAGSFKLQNQAQSYLKILTNHGINGKIEEVMIKNNQKWYRVYAGPFENINLAEQTKNRMKRELQIDGIISKSH